MFSRVLRLMRDVKNVSVVPDTFSAVSPPKQVHDKSSRYVVIEYFYLSMILIEFAFCRRTWSVLKVVLHCQALIRPFYFSTRSYTVNQILACSYEILYKQY